jgi:MFS family permease
MDATPDLPLPQGQNLAVARVALSIVFLLLGFGAGIWAVHIPIIQARLGVDPGVLGLVMFAMACGAIVGMPVMGSLIARLGSRRPTVWATLAYTIVMALPVAAPDLPLLFAAAFVFGAALGSLDVAMNTQAAELEAARRRPTMSSFHGFFSVGGLVGSLVGAGIIAAGWGNGGGALVAALACLGLAAYAVARLFESGRPAAAGPRFALPSRAVVALGLIAFLCFAIEGAIGDWSALYLATIKGAAPAAAAAGFAMFSLAMAICRLIGDGIVARLGQTLTIVLGGALIVLGIAIAVIAPWPAVGAVGFALVGIGAANIVPVAFSVGARAPGAAASVNIAAVTTLGYSGFLVAPPLIGMVAKNFGLSAGLWLVAAGGLVVALIGVVRR